MSSAKLRAFLAVARHGSFSAGARALGLSQPTLTTQVQSLERQHNVELFHRRGRRIELSDVGQQLLPIAQRLAALELEAHNLLRDSGRLDSGQLKLGAVGPFHVIEMVDHYRQRHPRIEVSIRVGNSAEVLADLEQYVTDIAVLAGLHQDPGLCTVRYARHAIILFARHDHPLARRDSIALGELEGQPLLQREAGSTTRAALELALAQAGVTPRIAMEIGSREALREAVVRGIGLGAVSEAEFIPDPRIKPIRIEGDPVHTETYLYCLAERRNSLLISSFFEAALQGEIR
ncbi:MULTISPECIES: LysR substrate-binding domain-containing protein [unclassified Pseudomonas]|jgi:aminoethylphosphonate catabolism LysR family transcriptional regulator|uniref:LysR substrate-binding domain-containing protein n=1 Tax=unclassified Pseudomonas TaxID=196821 RepID=UPI00129E8F22|nr:MULTISPECIES: LysR substrate-binding domain-containing protein [unclassified Pseudomonas]MDH4652709.1 LysR family transcriptional regulator [Pseudomonas sp. BN606]MRK23424.1 LysR family transcriptional regulator [Pseudomonas sp. JG-B]